jgi:hypothetical protein
VSETKSRLSLGDLMHANERNLTAEQVNERKEIIRILNRPGFVGTYREAATIRNTENAAWKKHKGI